LIIHPICDLIRADCQQTPESPQWIRTRDSAACHLAHAAVIEKSLTDICLFAAREGDIAAPSARGDAKRIPWR